MMTYQSVGPSNAFEVSNQLENGVDGSQDSHSIGGGTGRKSSIGTGNKSSLQLGGGDGTISYPTLPSSSTMASSSTGRTRALSRSQIPQTSTSPSLEPKKLPGSELVDIYDRKHHQIPDAPYPLYYDSIITDLDHWDLVYFQNMKKSVSFVNFPEGRKPTKCLDLGCGTGAWIIDAAREWPECEFWGYDLVPIQPPTESLGEIGNRINWSHGNFVKERLPYYSETFDFVHIRFVARGVPENAWTAVFKEVHRVLAPDGVIELMEEDIIFPKISLPWDPLGLDDVQPTFFDDSFPDDTARGPNAETIYPKRPKEHPHRLLEWLHERLYDQEFISRRPTSTLTIFFNAYFSNVNCPPAINFPLPNPPIDEKDEKDPKPILTLREVVPMKAPSAPLSAEDTRRPGGAPLIESLDPSSPFSVNPQRDRSKSLYITPSSHDRSTPDSNASSSTTKRPHAKTEPPPSRIPRRPYLDMKAVMVSRSHSGSLSNGPDMFPLGELEDPNLSMHMYRSFQNVLAAREGMWKCLLKVIADKGNRENIELLESFGWDTVPGQQDEEEDALRERYEQRLEKFTQQMNARCALGQALSTSLSWDPPFKDPPTKKEVSRMEYEREYVEQHGTAPTPPTEESPASRSIRVFIGYKKKDLDDL